MQSEGGAHKRFWVRHKTQAVLRLLRGEDIDLVSRELGVTTATLAQWRDTFLEAGESDLKLQPARESVEVGRLREKIGEQAMKTSCFARRPASVASGPISKRGAQ